MRFQINAWNVAHKQERDHKKKPHEEINQLHKLFKANDVRKILDLGCGGGRHLVYFAKLGYAMSGLDFATEAIRQSQEWLAEEGLNAELLCGDMIQLPLPDDFFDAVISVQALEHHQFPSIQGIIGEIYRVLRDGGLFFAIVKKYPPQKDWKKGNYTPLDSHIYTPTEGLEKGIVHYFFTIVELQDILSGFDMIKIKEDRKHKNYCFLAQKIN